VVTVELQGQLLVQERELNSHDGAIITWEEGLASFVHALEEVHAECDAICAHADAV
jgi:hypothetical protein